MTDYFAPSGDKLVTLPVPVRDGVVARLDLPVRLTQSEADRIAAIIQSWPTDSPGRASYD